MTQERRCELTPQQFIRQLFDETREGLLSITYYPYQMEQPYTLTYAMDWDEEDMQRMVQIYEQISTMLHKFGQLKDRLQDPEARKELLTPGELEAWETLISPFSAFDVDEDLIAELYFRAEFDSLDDEENALLERHFWWREENCLERLPFRRCSPTKLILCARRYEYLVAIHAPQSVIREAGRCLAEELVLYCCGPQTKQTFREE